MDMTPEEIRDCAVKTVEEFINNKIPLSEGIAKEAQVNEFNPEQIKRVIEASNSIAYLKLLKEASDRTFEFPVANYEEVMGHLALPEDKLIVDVSDPMELNVPMEENVDKKDLGMFTEKCASEYSTDELELFLMKASIRNKADLEKLADRKIEIMLEMEDSMNKIKSQSFVLEKLAEVADEDLFNKLTPFFGLEKKAEEGIVFQNKDLNEVRRLVELCKEAVAVKLSQDEKEGFDKRAFDIISGMASASKVGVGKVVGGFSTAIGKGVAPIINKGTYRAGTALGAGVLAGPALAAKGVATLGKHMGAGGVLNSALAVSGASSYKPKNEDVWKALHN